MRAYINENGVQGDRIYKYYRRFSFSSNGSFIVPFSVKQLIVDCVAGQGWSASSSVVGGYGGRVQCRLAVTGGQTLYIVVGVQRTANNQDYNASDIRTVSNDLTSRLIVAGGGGNSSTSIYLSYSGGNGGGLTGAAGNYGQFWSGEGRGSVYAVAQGGNQSAGGTGAGATAYVNYDNRTTGAGSFGTGGSGMGNGTGGCGGSGYYGGGGGVAGNYADGRTAGSSTCSGAGGSSYTSPLCSQVKHLQGYQSGNGYVTLSYEVSEHDGYDYKEGFTGLVRNR